MKEMRERGMVAKMTPTVAEGLAYHQIGENCHLAVHNLLMRELGPQNDRLPKGFSYISWKPYSVEEMFKWQMRNKNKRSPGVDVARSDYYMVKYEFSILDDDGRSFKLERPLLIPYVNPYNILNVSGSQRLISAVWHQPGLGFVNDGFFVHFPFSKRITFKFENSLISVHGNDERCYLPYSTTLKARKGSATTNLPLVAYWLFAKYGFRGAIKRYLGVDVDVYSGDYRGSGDIRLDQYTIVESRLGGRSRDNLFVAVPVEHLGREISKRTPEEKQLLTLITSLFYAHKHQPDHLSYDDVNDPDVWIRILGYSIEGKNVQSEAQLYKEIEKHLIEAERYYCERFRHEMEVAGVTDLDNTFDFLFHVIRSTVKVFNIPKSELSSVYGKCLKTIDYLFSGEGGLAKSINDIRWRLTTLADKEFEETGTRVVSEGSVRNIVNSHLYVSLLNKITSGHGEVSHLSSTSECALFGMTTHAIDQTDATNKSKQGNKTIDLDDPSIHRNASRLEACNYGYVTKPSPFGDGVLNPYVTLGRHYEVVPNPKHRAILEEAQADLAQRGNLK
jgi:hypothetical protein